MAVLRYVSDHNETVFGTLVVLFLVTAMLLIIRQLGERANQPEADASGGGAIINIGEIETALKRVLSSQSYAAEQAAEQAAEAADEPSAAPKVVTDPKLVQALKERDLKIKQMEAELEQTRSIASALTTPTESTGSAADKAKLTELEEKLTELKSRLAEYEIIEDDIADLSIYKEENAKLKKSIEEMRAQLTSAGVSVAEAINAPEAAPEPVAAPAKKSEGFEIDPNDELMQEFASTVQVGKAPPPITINRLEAPPEAVADETASSEPAGEEAQAVSGEAPHAEESVNPALEGAVDTDKMLTEVGTLHTLEAEPADALEDTLDTDKLLAEMSSLGMPVPAPAAAPAPAPAAPAPKAETPAAAVETPSEEAFEDDLLAEFKDSKQ